MNSNPPAEQGERQLKKKRFPWGLVAIITAIVIGSLVGIFYGQTMWVASGGRGEEIEKLRTKVIPQKWQYAKLSAAEAIELREAGETAEADRAADRAAELITHIETIEQRVAELETAEAIHQEQLGNQGRELLAEKLPEEVASRYQEFADQATELAAASEEANQPQAVAVYESWAVKFSAMAVNAREQGEQLAAELADNPPAIDSSAGFQDGVASFVSQLITFCGDLFLQILKMLVVPLVVTSMICGITSLGDIRKIGRMGGVTLLYYFTTGAVAVIIGIVLVLMIQPGAAADDTFAFVNENVETKQGMGVVETLFNVFRGRKGEPGTGMFPDNIFRAAAGTNVLALIAFSIVFGGVLTTLGEKGKPVIRFFEGANEAIMKIVHLVMYLAPIGIFGLVASKIAENGGGAAFFEELGRIGWYAGTVILGLTIHVFVLGTLLTLLGKRNPFTYTLGLGRALLTAVSTASSSATLPITMECVEENNQVSNRSASFVLPLGATVNMDGTALYEAVAVIFIAQSIGYSLSLGKLIVIFLTASLAAIGAAGIPEAGLVTMVLVLQAVGLPVSGIGAILAIDWFLDRMRTTVNVYGDAIGAGVIDELVVKKEESV